MPASWLGTSGPLTTAGGLMFRGSAGGQVEAYDARTGTRAWTFRTSPTGTLVRPGPASVYALDGRQHIAITMGTELWSFVLDGEIPARGEPVLDPWEDYERPQPEPTATRRIETATLIEGTRGMVGGTRYGFDEHHFNPTRALVRRGARLQFINNGEITHTNAARDGSWSTGPVEPASSASITLGDLGTFLYHCIDHPWAIGQITVEDGP